MREAKRQEKNEELRKMFARHTNSFHGWLTDTRTALMDGRGGLEEQLETVKVCVCMCGVCVVCVWCVCGVCVVCVVCVWCVCGVCVLGCQKCLEQSVYTFYLSTV